jgi:hypothetical protein
MPLSIQQEQARINRLKQIYANNGICPDFLYLKDGNFNSDSLCSMEPLLI